MVIIEVLNKVEGSIYFKILYYELVKFDCNEDRIEILDV